jgi:16S rRNA (uracil1498-N3)-methyltransferase
VRPRRLAWPLGAPRTEREITLDRAQARHGLLALRLTVGREVTLTSPWGLCPAVVKRADRQRLILTVEPVGEFEATQAATGPTLALPLLRPSRFDWAVEKAVELGARELWPILPARSRARQPDSQKPERWRRLAEEARKQCARAQPLAIAEILTWPDFLTRASSFAGLRLRLDPSGASWPVESMGDPLLVVGPEGGLTESETADLVALGFHPVSLGPWALRSETAALAALAQLGGLVRAG